MLLIPADVRNHQFTLSVNEPPPPSRTHLRWIDNLRGLAVISVVLQHLLSDQFRSNPSNKPLVDFGIFGVNIFFLISGYVIPYSIVSSRNKPALRFVVARMFRLLPAYWLSLLFALLIFHPALKEWLVNLTMLQRFVGTKDIVGVYWTLQVEVIFYTVITGLLILNRFRSKTLYPTLSICFAILAIGAGLGRFHLGKKMPLAPLSGLSLMFMATTYYLHATQALFSRAKLLVFGIAVVALLCVAYLFGYSRDWGYNESPHRFIAMLALALGVFAFYHFRRPQNLLLESIGKISYPMYLFHVPLILVFISGESSKKATLGKYAVFTSCLLLLCAIVRHLVEIPFVKLGRSATTKVLSWKIKWPSRIYN